MVGMVVTISPSLSLYRIVVFPAASSPTIKILISFLPNRPLNKFAKMLPILAGWVVDGCVHTEVLPPKHPKQTGDKHYERHEHRPPFSVNRYVSSHRHSGTTASTDAQKLWRGLGNPDVNFGQLFPQNYARKREIGGCQAHIWKPATRVFSHVLKWRKSGGLKVLNGREPARHRTELLQCLTRETRRFATSVSWIRSLN